ncbi:MAG: leucine-rich repeat protein [Bacteroidales bacterium]
MKTKFRFLLMLSLALILAQTATAAIITVDNLTYETSEDGTAAVSGYDETPTGELEIPATVEYDGITYNVTSIKDGDAKESGVFYNCTGITSVKLSEGLTSIAKYAFYGCNGMISVNIPESVKIISVNAFLGCRKLASIDLPSNLVTIGNYAFNNCVLLTTVDIPASVTSIGANAFKGCSALASVYFNWTDESKIVSPSTDVFTNISASAILYVPTDCTSYYQDWATYFTSVDEFTTEPDEDTPSTEPTEVILTYDTDADASTAEVTGYDGVTGLVPTGELVIPATVEIEGITYNVTSIANGTSATVSPFAGCTGITSVVLPESITSIGDFAFNKCSNLKSINLPSGVTALGKYAFGTCGLESIKIPSSLTSIGNNVFNGCSSLSEVYVYWTESPTTVNAGIFANIFSSATLYIPAGTTSVYEASTWSSINVFTLIEVGDTTDPDEDTPSTEPTEVILTYDTDADASTAEVTGYDVTGLVPTGELVIPATVEIEGITYDVTSIADGNGTNAPFLNCTGITAIVFPEGLITIGTYAFRGCTGITSLDIASSVTTIGNFAFAYCTNLESINIASSVTSFGNNIFSNCTKISKVYVHWTDTPSSINTGIFGGICNDDKTEINATLYIPAGTKSVYEADSVWSLFTSTLEDAESKEVRVNSTETLTLTGGEEYELITIAEDGEVNAEGLKDITVEKLEVIKTFTYTDGKENNEEWFNLGLPFEVTAGTGSVLKLVNGVYEEAVQGVDYATYDYNGERRLTNGADDGNWDMYVDDSGLIGEAIQFVTNSTHTYKFIAADQDAATTALTAGREGNRFCDADNTSDDNGWNVIPAGKTYTGTYFIEDVSIMQVLNSNGLFTSNDECKFAPGTVFAVKLSSSEANTNVTTSDDESAEITVEKYKFELVDADGVVLDRIFIFDGSDKQQYRVGKMSALSDDKTEMSIQANDKSYCAYSTLASETDKSYTVAISNATEGAQLIMTKAGTQSVTLDDTAVALDSPMAVEDGQITITIGSKVSSVTDATASAKVYAANGSIIIEGAGAYAITNMSGIIVANGVADSKTAINVASGAYIVNVAGEISKVIVK